MGDEVSVLKALRLDIDEIDRKIVRLLNERFDICIKIARQKGQLGLNVVDIRRQDEVLQNVVSVSKFDFASSNKEIFSTIMALSSAEQLKFISNIKNK